MIALATNCQYYSIKFSIFNIFLFDVFKSSTFSSKIALDIIRPPPFTVPAQSLLSQSQCLAKCHIHGDWLVSSIFHPVVHQKVWQSEKRVAVIEGDHHDENCRNVLLS